ncbi:uncharacterized protein [Argopecten irradians]|uniref:uncharacterized protein n=1 Tax=Argopecten irradians TaxID=31199 RepID=UPI00371489B3
MKIPLNRFLLPDKYPVLFLIVSRVHAYVVGNATILQWRGYWGLFDLYLTTEWLNSFLGGLIGMFILSGLGKINVIAGQPTCLQHDFDTEDYFTVTEISRQIQHIRDWVWLFIYGLYDSVVFNLLIVVSWRLSWNLADDYLLPEDPALSAYISFFMCVTFAFPLLLGERSIRNYCKKKETNIAMKAFKSCIAKCYLFLASAVTVTSWRGVWNLQTALLLPERPALSALISHCVGFCGLVIMLVTRCATGGSTFDDNDMYSDKDTIFSMPWLKRFWENSKSSSLTVVQHEHVGVGKFTVSLQVESIVTITAAKRQEKYGVVKNRHSKATVAPQGESKLAIAQRQDNKVADATNGHSNAKVASHGENRVTFASHGDSTVVITPQDIEGIRL